jgi:cobalt transporter subunit CbtB
MTATVQSYTLPLSHRIAIGLSAVFFGSFLVFAVGLAQDDRMHNAAHDTRHAIGFPCH